MEVYVSDINSSKSRGFTLIEVLISIGLLAFLAVGILGMTTMSINSNSYVQHHTKAVQLAESGLEELRRVDYVNQLSAYNGVIQDFGSIPNYPGFRRAFTVDHAADISTMTVSVTWRVRGTTSFPLVLTSRRVAP